MKYIAMYRKYRPNNFKKVEGQKVVITTLQNALKKATIAHAYLFSGPRGTGKTSVAKIFAKAINCEHSIEGDVCNKCSTCKSLSGPTISDIIELDAASNNGVDEIRELREKARYAPSVAKYKVYIIDEVHMLTTSAFNALLKTLEEPPKHVIFILATTELHKIPATIISRCQCFEFKNIAKKDIVKKLNEIVKEENIKIEQDAINLIADIGSGALRDSIGLLDQVISYSQGTITKQDVYDVSGSIARDDLVTLLQAIEKKELSKALLLVEKLLEQGKEISKLISDLILLIKDILLNKALQDTNPSFQGLDRSISQAKLFHYINTLIELQYNIKWTILKKSYLEVAILKMMDFLETNKQDYEKQINDLKTEIDEMSSTILKTSEKLDKLKDTPQTYIRQENIKPKKERLVTSARITEILINGEKQKRLEITDKLSNIISKMDKTDVFKEVLEKLSLEVISKGTCLFSASSLQLAESLYETENMKKLITFLNSIDKTLTNAIIINRAEWDICKSKYASQIRNGIKRPILPEIDFKLYVKTKETKKSSALEITEQLFGNEIPIKIKSKENTK